MFKHLSRYNYIFVTGPQRSGTTIAAKMIAHDTGHKYIDEADFNTANEEKFFSILKSHKNIVVQCPAMSHMIHDIADDKSLVVIMLRDIDDIVASEKRVKWSIGPYLELERFGMSRKRAVSFRRRGGKVSELKYQRWEKEQKDKIPHYIELEYESLSSHPMWVPKEKRINWGIKQAR